MPGSAIRCVEFLGPPGAGKTTLAWAVADEFRRRGVAVHLSLSARPGEVAPGDGAPAGPTRAAKLLGLLGGARDPLVDDLLRLMPLGTGLRARRRRRYLADLSAERGQGALALRDQGWLCAIAGLAHDSGRNQADDLDAALDLVPLPAIAVRVSVPCEVAEARLAQRLARQGRLERLLERPPADNIALTEVFDLVCDLFARRGRPLVDVSSRDHGTLAEGVRAVTEAVGAAATAPRLRGAAS